MGSAATDLCAQPFEHWRSNRMKLVCFVTAIAAALLFAASDGVVRIVDILINGYKFI